MEKEKREGITLITLIITIIVLLILSGVSIATLTGEGGILNKTNTAKTQNTQVSIEEEIKLAYNTVQTESIINSWDLNQKAEELKKELDKGLTKEEKTIVLVVETDLAITYKGYEILISDNGKIEMEDTTKEKPELIVTSLTTETDADQVRIKVSATITEGDIESIESLNGIKLVEDVSNNEKIFETEKNGIYYFKAKGTNGRTTKKEIEINNILEKNESLLQAISEINESGEKVVTVKGKTNTGTVEMKNYSLNVIYADKDVVLDGEMPIMINDEITVTPNNKIYEFGSERDVGTAGDTGYAKNTVVLKVNGNLTINEGVTLTSVKSSQNFGGPKGMVIYCTGTIINNGRISMTARGGKAVGENVYLWKNEDGSYEYVPAIRWCWRSDRVNFYKCFGECRERLWN